MDGTALGIPNVKKSLPTHHAPTGQSSKDDEIICSGGYVIRLYGKNGPKRPILVQADMLSACMEYEDILSDKQRGCSAVYFGFKILILGSGG